MTQHLRLGELVRVLPMHSFPPWGQYGIIVNVLQNMSKWRGPPVPSDDVMYEVFFENKTFYFNLNELELFHGE